ncbi:hypothetical protein SFC10_01325 [Streptococcus ruminicola]|uniref:hypothetical protein n=1 Tax=Streptococcus ruminicola TaxID=2686210 RepID=UPI003982C853
MSKILFLVPKSQEDFSFIESCQIKKDYISNINDSVRTGDRSDINDTSTLIITDEGIRIGIFIPNVYKVTGLSNGRPIIYVLKEYRILSSFVICEMVRYLFEVKKVDRLIIQIYSNNIQMINCMNNFEIPMRGEIKEIRNLDGEFVSILFFDISVEGYFRIRSNFIE